MLRRALPVTALLLALAALLVLVLGSHRDFRLHVRFVDAGQLVTGDEAVVAGRPVGKIEAITLTGDGQADVRLRLDAAAADLRQGTTARIRAPGSSGVANRYVELMPGPAGGARLPSGSTLPALQNQGIVDIDQILDDLDPATRRRLRSVLVQSARATKGTGAALNAALRSIDPATSRSAALLREVTADRPALRTLVGAGARVAGTLSTDATTIGQTADEAAQTLDAVAAERRHLGGVLRQAPPVMRQASGTLGRLGATLAQARPVLRELRPAAAPLADTLRAVAALPPATAPALRGLQAQLPALRRALHGLPALRRRAVPALDQTRATIATLLPIATGLRPYTSDFINGFFQGFGGSTGAGYDADGHYIRVNFLNGGGGLEGLFSSLSGALPPGYRHRTGVTGRCPGGAEQPAADGSSPYLLQPGICRAKDTAP